VRAAVNPEQHRQMRLRRNARRANRKIETVLATLGGVFFVPTLVVLQARRRRLRRVAHPFPWRHGRRRTPPQLSDRRLCVWNSRNQKAAIRLVDALHDTAADRHFRGVRRNAGTAENQRTPKRLHLAAFTYLSTNARIVW